jgi:dUTP pyrophosphatase
MKKRGTMDKPNSINPDLVNFVSKPDTRFNLTFVNRSNNPNPEYATSGSSGFDLRANLPENRKHIYIPTGHHVTIPTGLYFNIPDGFEIQVRPRSGLASNFGITVLNTPGTIDSDFIGEIQVVLINHGINSYCVMHGDKIAQAVMAPVTAKNIFELTQVDSINKETERSDGGFGHTGIN